MLTVDTSGPSEIRGEGKKAVCSMPRKISSMRRALAFLTLPTTLFLFTGCDGNTNTPPDASTPAETDAGTPPPSPKIITFEATEDAVPRGETVELHWKVENAQLINIFSATEILV